MLDADLEARHLRMRIGRIASPWHANRLAVALAQGFVGPLEATALMFIQHTAMTFVQVLERGDLSEEARRRFNTGLNRQFEGIRDHIIAHYKTNSRTDTEY